MIFNMIGGAGGNDGYAYNISNFAYTNEDANVTSTWNDPDDNTWAGTLILAKQGNYPDGPDDADAMVVVDSKVWNQYQTDGYTKGGFAAGTWYFQAFPYNADSEYNVSVLNRLQVTVTYIYPSPLVSFDVKAGNATATLSYELPPDATGLTVVYKAGSAPTSLSDGTVISNPATGHIVTGLINETTYYFRAEPYNQYGRYGTASTTQATPMPWQIYGISIDYTQASPEWTRTDDAVGFTATASVGTVAGSSSFDTCMPWSGIRRCNLAADGTVNAYMGDASYAVDGSNGDVMVEIPKFWYRRYREGNIEYIKIADGAADGFTLHPAFTHAGVEADYVYVGAYKTSSNNKSVTGASPTASATRATFRTNAKNKGTGWSIIDIAAISAIQMLALVEFATNNAQAVIGRGYCDGNSASLTSGSCDSVPNLTGRPSGTDGKTGVVYRGIEDFWGNVWEWADGANFNGGKYYVCNDISKYADDTATNYEELSFTSATNWSQSYITQEGLDTGDNAHVMLPSAAGSGSETTYQCDACWSSTGWRVFIHGGVWSNGSACGLFTARLSYASSGTYTAIGSRLLYVPQSA